MKKQFRFIFLLLALVTLFSLSCSGDSPAPAACTLPAPFCGGAFPLNTQQTTAYGPAWADVTTSSSDWVTCFGPYALCYYANCTSSPGSNGTVADCSCFEAYGTNFVDINAILNNDVYNDTKNFCSANPTACQTPNQAPICASLSSGDFMSGASLFSTFSFYRATEEPIGMTSCVDQPALYAGCMTSPCFGASTPGVDNTSMISCQCPTYNGPFQAGLDNLSCVDSPLIYSAAYNTNPPAPHSQCSKINGCVPDAPTGSCGCGLYVPGTTVLPPSSGVNCTTVCQEYNTCQRAGTIELGYTCDATLCTSQSHDLLFDACTGLQNCDLSEIFKAEKAAGCSCCASQLCGCTPNTATDHKIQTLDSDQRNIGEVPQCDINGTLCGS